jgi:hypothetical protein
MLGRCPLGFPGCGCGDELTLRAEILNGGDAKAIEQNDKVTGWWRARTPS